MWILGLLLLLLGVLLGSSVLFWVGLVILIVGLAFYFVPARHDSRRWYW